MRTSIWPRCCKTWIACRKRWPMPSARWPCVRIVPARATILAMSCERWAGAMTLLRNTRPRSGSIRTPSWRITIAAWRCAARPGLRKRARISRGRLRSGRIFWKRSWRYAWPSFRPFTQTLPKSRNSAMPMRADWPGCARTSKAPARPRHWRTRSVRISRSIFLTRVITSASFRSRMDRWFARSWPRDTRRRFRQIFQVRTSRSGSVSSADFSGSIRTGRSRSRGGSPSSTATGFISRAITRAANGTTKPMPRKRYAIALCRARCRSTPGAARSKTTHLMF